MPKTTQGQGKKMIDKDWLKRKIESDPDCEVEAGVLHPEAPSSDPQQEKRHTPNLWTLSGSHDYPAVFWINLNGQKMATFKPGKLTSSDMEAILNSRATHLSTIEAQAKTIEAMREAIKLALTTPGMIKGREALEAALALAQTEKADVENR
jgi:hypothetical protein